MQPARVHLPAEVGLDCFLFMADISVMTFMCGKKPGERFHVLLGLVLQSQEPAHYVRIHMVDIDCARCLFMLPLVTVVRKFTFALSESYKLSSPLCHQ